MSQESDHNSHKPMSNKRKKDYRWNQFGSSGFEAFLDQLSRRLEINVETFLVGAISLLITSIALLMDQFPLYLLAILITPILSPILGFAFGFSLGSFKFLKIGFLTLILNMVSFLVVGAFSGFIARQFPEGKFTIWEYFIEFNWSGLVLLAAGILIMVSTIIRNPRQASIVANVALAYCFYLPLASSAFAYGMGDQVKFFTGLQTFGLYFGFAIVVSVLVLMFYKIRPQKLLNWWGMVVLILIISLILFLQFRPVIDDEIQVLEVIQTENIPTATSTQNEKLQFTSSPTMSNLETKSTDEIPTLNITSKPTATNTITLTPLPSIIWAEINSPEGNGANIRVEPGFSSNILRTVLNGTSVQILDEAVVIDGVTWIHIRFIDQVEGWIVRGLLVSATPEPDW